eukprot:Nitzschia sp. Nitz4//scaffold40_size135432//82134//87650//NITZ4_003253-RA/size135432-processed-gene-0.70-mRNA-1//-1//CDS//3329551246//8803//frame0
MVSRTPRHQSQPRSTRPRAPQAFEAWENVNDNARGASQPHRNSAPLDQRRAMSSIRHQPNSRGPPIMMSASGHLRQPSPMRGDPGNPGGVPSKIPTTLVTRPRPVSAGRVRAYPQPPMDPRENPNDVTRQIMDLRERRESGSFHKRRTGKEPQPAGQPRPNAALLSTAASLTKSSDPRSSPTNRQLKKASSGISQDDGTTERIKRAETKISGMLDELEELKFFQELESEDLPARPQSTRGTPRNAAMGPPGTPRQEQSMALAPRMERAPSRGKDRGVVDPSRTVGIPTNIRTVSPARGGRLPPPPPVHNGAPGIKGANSGGLETYIPLSPRAIAKLDRNSLELECQTLVRKIQIIEQDRNSQSAMIEMYEVSLQDHDADKAKVNKLQGELSKVSTELKRQLQSVSKGKETLIKDYEEKLQNNLTKLHRMTEKADSYKMEMEASKQEARRTKEALEALKGKAQGDATKAEDLKAREKILEVQLQEARNLNATLVQKVEKKRAEVTALENDLSQTTQQLREDKLQRDQEHEAKIQSMQQELAEMQEKYTRMEQDFIDRDEQVTLQEKKLELAQTYESEQNSLIEELKARIQELELETIAKFEEGKKVTKSQETRKMQELVAERANQTHEYERRIKAMQEQLRHQADRHHAEVQETRRRNDERLEAMRDEIRDELQLQEGEKMYKLQTEISVLRRTYEESKDDFAARLKEAQQKSRDTAADFQRQDEARQQELDHMHNRIDGLIKELAEKQSQITETTSKLEDARNHSDAVEAEKSRVLAQIERLEEKLEDERASATNRELEFDAHMDAAKADFTMLEERLKQEIQELSDKLDETKKELAKTAPLVGENATIKERLSRLESELESTQSTLQDERARHEDAESELRVELARQEGKLRASESSLKTKKTQIQELETQLEMASTTSSRAGEQKQMEIVSLQKQLQETSAKLDSEHTTVAQLESELSEVRAELKQVSKSHEETRSKLLDAERRNSLDKADLEATVAELKRKAESLETEKIRRETELDNLRKDYEDLSGLLEENLHSSAKKDELDLQLKRREREMRATVDNYNTSVEELENKLKQAEKTKEALEEKANGLQDKVDNLNDEKMKLRSDLSALRQRFETISSELESSRSSRQGSPSEAELGRKDRNMREAVQRYTRTIADLEAKLEEELQTKAELTDKLESARSELEDKQKQTQELIQKHTKQSLGVQSDLSRVEFEKEELKARLEQTNKDLEQKRKELKQTVAKYSNEVSEFHNVKQEHNEFRQISESTKEELALKTKQVNELKQKIPELLSELQAKNRECEENKTAAKKLEAELSKRKDQFNEVVARYTDQVAKLESQLDEQSMARTNTEDRVESVRAEAMRKDNKIRELQNTISELETKLEIANNNRDMAKQKADSIVQELEDKENEARKFEMENIELQTKLHTQSRSKDELRGKVSDLSSKLERKEREVREVTDRYKMYVMELESKLDQDTDAKHKLQLDIDRLKSNLSSAEEASNEAAELREKVYNLEKTVESYRGKARDVEYKSKDSINSLEDKLAFATKAKDEIEETLKTVQSEKAEVIAALEGVINEVQNRDDHIESLSELLQRRDEELQHAKIIATKALQSAKDIQKRFKDKDKNMHSGMQGQVDELMDTVDALNGKNETLQRKISMLERDLRDRNLECKRLKDQLRHIDGNGLRDNRDPVKDDGSAFTQSTFASSRGGDDRYHTGASSSGSMNGRGLRIDPGNSMDPDGIGMGSSSFSPAGSSSPTSPEAAFSEGDAFNKDADFGMHEFSDGGDSGIITDDADRWHTDFETESRGYDSVSSDQMSKSRRSIERDALRKYVRQRYNAKR